MKHADTFQFSEFIDGREYNFKITPIQAGYRIDEDGTYKAEIIKHGPEKPQLKGELSPRSLQAVVSWINARYD